MPICLRAYYKLHLYYGKKTEDRLQRLSLMLEILKLVDRWYKRHINHGKAMRIIFGSLRFFNPCHHYRDNVEEMRSVATEEQKVIFKDYDEVNRLITDSLPPIEDIKVRNYLIWLVRTIANHYSSDNAHLRAHERRDFYGNRIYDDEGDYENLHKEMEMLSLENFILLETFTEEKLQSFFFDYSLR